MKTQIIPTLFALNKETFNSKLKSLMFAKLIHLDFMDGKFTKNSSIGINDMNNLNKFKKEYEIHLMAKNPIQYLNSIKKYNIVKILIQFEAFNSSEELLSQLKDFKIDFKEVFLVINPETDVEDILPILSEFDGIMLMSVNPGAESQEFIETTLSKIKTLRKLSPKLKIQVDGGIKLRNAKRIDSFGANILSIGSAISSSKNPKQACDNFNKIFT